MRFWRTFQSFLNEYINYLWALEDHGATFTGEFLRPGLLLCSFTQRTVESIEAKRGSSDIPTLLTREPFVEPFVSIAGQMNGIDICFAAKQG